MKAEQIKSTNSIYINMHIISRFKTLSYFLQLKRFIAITTTHSKYTQIVYDITQCVILMACKHIDILVNPRNIADYPLCLEDGTLLDTTINNSKYHTLAAI